MTRKHERHGQRGTRLYSIWKGMNQRCTDPRHSAFARYGALGIRVCTEWQLFSGFKAWADSSGYLDTLTLDRIDNAKGYDQSNCKWSTPKQQAENSSVPVLVTAFGQTKNLSDWADDPLCAVPRETLGYRIRQGWEPETAITKRSRVGKWEVTNHDLVRDLESMDCAGN